MTVRDFVHVLVDTPRNLSRALPSVDAAVVGVDVERTDAPRYFKPAALVQVGTADAAVLIDTLRLGTSEPTGQFLRQRRCVLHAATNDIESLDGAGMRLDTLDDTSIAAALLGLPTGLDPLLQATLDISLGEDKGRFQRADWEQRPLPDDMAAYAANDVVHLPALMDVLTDRLITSGRLSWYQQERDHMLVTTRRSSRTWQDISGAGRLDESQRAVLRALWETREQLARQRDVAVQRLLRDPTLIDLASDPASDPSDLARRNQRRGQPDTDTASVLWSAQQEGLHASPEPLPDQGGRRSSADRDRHAALRAARSTVAEDLGIDAGVLCPGRVLWSAVHADPRDPDELIEAVDLRPWQRELLRDPLWKAWQDSRPADVATGP